MSVSEPVALWAERARRQLSVPLRAARSLAEELGEGSLESSRRTADLLAAESDAALAWLARDACPNPHAGAELGSALGVLRNAAFLFRRMHDRLSEPGGEEVAPTEQTDGLAGSCAALLEQGLMHYAAFERVVAAAWQSD